MPTLASIKKQLYALADPKRAKILQRFFKTGKGEYGEGDKFIGVTVPLIRSLVKQSRDLEIKDIKKLVCSPIHEERMLGLLSLVSLYQKGDAATKAAVFKAYVTSRKFINSWDLVDLTAPHILGAYLTDDHSLLHKWSESKNLWERRMAMLAMFYEIKRQNHQPAIIMADKLLHDEHDLIHKAVGWMLREVGKRCDEQILEEFLKTRHKTMPRTMLRYAIEKFPEKKRQQYLNPPTP